MAIFPGEPGLANFIGAEDNESAGDNWSYKTCKAPVRSPQRTNTQLFTGPSCGIGPRCKLLRNNANICRICKVNTEICLIVFNVNCNCDSRCSWV